MGVSAPAQALKFILLEFFSCATPSCMHWCSHLILTHHPQGVGHEEAYTTITVSNTGVTSCSQSGVSASKGTAQIFPVSDIIGSSKMLKTDLKMKFEK